MRRSFLFFLLGLIIGVVATSAQDDPLTTIDTFSAYIAPKLIAPVVVIFIDPRDPNRPSNNRRESEYIENPAFAQFVAEELVQNIDRVFKTAPSAENRAILGTSLGWHRLISR